MELSGANTGVYGLGITGQATVRFLKRQGAVPVVVDEVALLGPREELEKLAREYDVEAHFGDFSPEALAACELIILSPGVRPDAPKLEAARRAGREIISEIELAARVCPAHLIAVTGSNGKSTTTALTAHILSLSRTAYAVGNIGKAFIDVADSAQPEEVVCCEVSSYQLEASPTLAPEIAIITNITPDHLERHESFANYARVKRSIVKAMAEGSSLIYNAEDENLQPELFPPRPVRFIPFSSAGEVGPPGAYLENGTIYLHVDESPIQLPSDLLRLPGIHNQENALAAISAARLMGAHKSDLAKGLRTFEGFPHRLEFVRELDEIRYYNDSKATNPEAAVVALRSFEQPVVLIAGGRDKGTDLGELTRTVKQHCAGVVLLGEAAERFEQALQAADYGAVHRVGSLEDAAAKAQQLAQPGNIVLLSPACASFDMFASFEQRGDRFKELVSGL